LHVSAHTELPDSPTPHTSVGMQSADVVHPAPSNPNVGAPASPDPLLPEQPNVSDSRATSNELERSGRIIMGGAI
jgi:hypothetical protein